MYNVFLIIQLDSIPYKLDQIAATIDSLPDEQHCLVVDGKTIGEICDERRRVPSKNEEGKEGRKEGRNEGRKEVRREGRKEARMIERKEGRMIGRKD